MPSQKRGRVKEEDEGGGGGPTLPASGRPNEIPFVIKPRALDNDGGGQRRAPSAALEIYPHFPRVHYVACLAPKDFSQLTYAQESCYNNSNKSLFTHIP